MKKILAVSLTAAGLVGLVGANLASAHGWFGGFGQMFNLSPEDFAQKQEAMFQNQSEILGISAEQFKDSWAEGKNFRQIAEEQGLSQEELQAKMQEVRQAQLEERLQIMVENGVISQEQADQRLGFMTKQMAEDKIGRMGTRADFGKRGFGPGCPCPEPEAE